MSSKFSTYLGTKSRLDDFVEKGLLGASRITSFLRGEVLVSQLGMGTYRLHHDIPEHAAAIGSALCSGVNLIDTAPNYAFGGSEKLIGKVLESLGGSEIRDQVVIVSKGGIFQGIEANLIGDLSARGEDIPGLVSLSEDSWACYHPVLLELQLQESLKRLGTESLDVYLLHNPEILLEQLLEEKKNDLESLLVEFYKVIEKAFIWLEEKVSQGKVLYYGLSSNNLLSALEPTRLISLTSLMECAKKAAKVTKAQVEHHFQVIQFPLNPLEMEGYESIFKAASELGLDVLINRPLNATRDGKLFRLARREYLDDEDYDSTIERSLDCIEGFEQAFMNAMEEYADPGFHLFKVGSELREVLERLEDSDHLHELMNYYFLPHTQRSIAWLESSGEGEWLGRANTYLEAWEKLEIAVHGRLNRDEYTKITKPILGDAYDLLKADELQLDGGILRFLMSFPSRQVVLNGMRSPRQVKSSTEALIHEDHPSFQRLVQSFS